MRLPCKAVSQGVFFCYNESMNICLFSQEEYGAPLPCRDERAQHIIKVLHKGVGDTFAAGIINGAAGIARITGIDDAGISYLFEPTSDGKPLHPLKMIIGFPRPIQLKRLLRDVAAIGASEVHLTGTELGEKSYMQSNMAERGTAYQMLVDGTVQAAGTRVPELFLHKTLKECVQSICGTSSDPADMLKLCMDNVNPAGTLVSVLNEKKGKESVVAAIGSERGWTQNERDFLEQSGFVRCGMGNRVMRTETAATVSAGVICAYMGWLE